MVTRTVSESRQFMWRYVFKIPNICVASEWRVSRCILQHIQHVSKSKYQVGIGNGSSSNLQMKQKSEKYLKKASD